MQKWIEDPPQAPGTRRRVHKATPILSNVLVHMEHETMPHRRGGLTIGSTTTEMIGSCNMPVVLFR